MKLPWDFSVSLETPWCAAEHSLGNPVLQIRHLTMKYFLKFTKYQGVGFGVLQSCLSD